MFGVEELLFEKFINFIFGLIVNYGDLILMVDYYNIKLEDRFYFVLICDVFIIVVIDFDVDGYDVY